MSQFASTFTLSKKDVSRIFNSKDGIVRNALFNLVFKKEPESPCSRFIIIIKKKDVRLAVNRNRIKRKMRHALFNNDFLEKKIWGAFICKPLALTLSFEKMKEQIRDALGKC